MRKFNHHLPKTISEAKSKSADIGTKERLAYIRDRGKASAYTHKPEVRERIFGRDNHHCLQCGSKNNLTIDHVISVVRDGSNKDINLQTLCKSCNSRKAP